MAKQIWKPGTMIYPIPAVMVSCGSKPEEYNIITIAWTGILATDPATCYISVRRERHSYDIIRKNLCFVINITTRNLAFATDWCGVRSGRDFDKFKEMKLTAAPSGIAAPIIEESPINIECVVKEIKEMGSHDVFIAAINSIHADEKYIDPVSGALDLRKAEPIAYCHGKYYALGEYIGKFGYSVEKKKNSTK